MFTKVLIVALSVSAALTWIGIARADGTVQICDANLEHCHTAPLHPAPAPAPKPPIDGGTPGSR